jgi:hypothetical protein
MKSKSSKKSGNQILGVMAVSRAERLLLDWANLPEWRGDFATRAARYHRQNIAQVAAVPAPNQAQKPAYQRIVQRYPEVFADVSEHSAEIARIFGMLLRKAWDAPNLRKKEWYLTDAEAFYHRTALGIADPPEQATPLEAVMFHFKRNLDRALHCPNPDCPAPYFLATKKHQKFCSIVCAGPSQREAKRRWWNANRGKRKRTR